MNSVEVVAFPRLHFGLCDLAGCSFRRFGGSGVSIEDPPIRVSVCKSAGDEIEISSLASLDQKGISDLRRALLAMRKFGDLPPVSIQIKTLPPQHVGFGTKTSLILAVLKGYSDSTGFGISREKMAEISGRGGASGIGIHTFFDGGFVVDAGHPRIESDDFMPSSFAKPDSCPLRVLRLAIPQNWRFALFLPKGKRLSGVSELEFFKENTPIEKSEINETVTLVYHGLVPSIANSNVSVLKEVLQRMHQIGFKSKELEAQSSEVKRFFHYASCEMDAAIGMSSLGPLVYAIDNDSCAFRSTCVRIAKHCNAQLVAIAKGNNAAAKTND